jgi:hypothetical protein
MLLQADVAPCAGKQCRLLIPARRSSSCHSPVAVAGRMCGMLVSEVAGSMPCLCDLIPALHECFRRRASRAFLTSVCVWAPLRSQGRSSSGAAAVAGPVWADAPVVLFMNARLSLCSACAAVSMVAYMMCGPDSGGEASCPSCAAAGCATGFEAAPERVSCHSDLKDGLAQGLSKLVLAPFMMHWECQQRGCVYVPRVVGELATCILSATDSC